MLNWKIKLKNGTSVAEVIMDAEVESVMASSQDQREEELQVITNSLSYKLSYRIYSTISRSRL